jgi:ABC-type uncharacterized transport system ATPase subunit
MCVFCKIINGEIPSAKVYEDEDVLAILDLSQAEKGHTLVLPKKHFDTFLDADDSTCEKVFVVAKKLANKIIEELKVVTPDANTPVRRLSGGNVQKVLVGREIAAAPTVLMAAYPVRGLDINSSYTIYNLLTEQKEKGVAVIFVGEDLDVLIDLCDRILVLSAGRVTGIVDGRTTKKEELGLLMTKAKNGKENE